MAVSGIFGESNDFILRFLDKKVKIEKIVTTNQTNYILRRIHG